MATRLEAVADRRSKLSKLMWTDFCALVASLAVVAYAVYQAWL